MNKYEVIAQRLNDYTGDNIWEDIIWHLEDIDDDAIEQADPCHMSDTIIFTDGTEMLHSGGQWIVIHG